MKCQLMLFINWHDWAESFLLRQFRSSCSTDHGERRSSSYSNNVGRMFSLRIAMVALFSHGNWNDRFFYTNHKTMHHMCWLLRIFTKLRKFLGAQISTNTFKFDNSNELTAAVILRLNVSLSHTHSQQRRSFQIEQTQFPQNVFTFICEGNRRAQLVVHLAGGR